MITRPPASQVRGYDYFMITTLPVVHYSFKQVLAQVVFSPIQLPEVIP